MPQNLSTLLTTAAELSSSGASWKTVGQRVHRPAKTCCRWPSRLPNDWNRLYLEEQRKRYEESGAEALTRLRTLLHSDETKAQLRAAEILIRWGPHLALVEHNHGALTQLRSPEQIKADQEWAEMRQGAELTRQRMDKCSALRGLPPLNDDEFFEEWERELKEMGPPADYIERGCVSSCVSAQCADGANDGHGMLTQPRSPGLGGAVSGLLLAGALVVGLALTNWRTVGEASLLRR